jgi:uncharacterized membrane protein YkvA (DUF1232 family)
MLRAFAEELTTFARNFSESQFWKKLQHHAGKAGYELVEKAMTLYFVLQKPDLPPWVRTAVIGALGYFLWPMDTIPDFAPLIGYTDDLSVVAAALTAIAVHVDEDVRQRAKIKTREWLG